MVNSLNKFNCLESCTFHHANGITKLLIQPDVLSRALSLVYHGVFLSTCITLVDCISMDFS